MSTRGHHGLLLPAAGTYSYWNPSDKAANVALSDLNRVATGSVASAGNVRSVTGKNSGKWYIEFVASNFISSMGCGFATSAASLATFLGGTATGWALWGNYAGVDLRRYTNNTFVTHSARTMATGEVFGLAIDITTGNAWWSENGTFFSGNPAAGTGAMATFTGGTTIYLACSPFPSGSAWRLRANPVEIANAAPSGFTAGWPV